MFPDTKPQKISADFTAQLNRTSGFVPYKRALVSMAATTRSEVGRMTNLAKAAWLATLLVFVLISGAFGSSAHAQSGVASYYKSGSLTANGERFDPQGLTAAHRSLSFDTRVRVTSVDTGRSVVVRINDRGPFATDHAPHTVDDKNVEYDHASFGISGLETAVALCLDRLVSSRIIDLSFGAARVIGLHTSGVANVSMEVLR